MSPEELLRKIMEEFKKHLLESLSRIDEESSSQLEEDNGERERTGVAYFPLPGTPSWAVMVYPIVFTTLQAPLLLMAHCEVCAKGLADIVIETARESLLSPELYRLEMPEYVLALEQLRSCL